MSGEDNPVILGRSEGYYRRKAALWLDSAASFRRAYQRGDYHAFWMAREGVAMAARNRAALQAAHPEGEE